MTTVVYYSGFSAFTGIYFLLICPPQACISIPVAPTTEAPMDVCVELPLKCVAEIDDFQGEPNCSKYKSALDCLKNVIELCDESVREDDTTGQGREFGDSQSGNSNNVNISTSAHSNISYIPDPDIEIISYLFHGTNEEFQEKCSPHEDNTVSCSSSYLPERLCFFMFLLYINDVLML